MKYVFLESGQMRVCGAGGNAAPAPARRGPARISGKAAAAARAKPGLPARHWAGEGQGSAPPGARTRPATLRPQRSRHGGARGSAAESPQGNTWGDDHAKQCHGRGIPGERRRGRWPLGSGSAQWPVAGVRFPLHCDTFSLCYCLLFLKNHCITFLGGKFVKK